LSLVVPFAGTGGGEDGRADAPSRFNGVSKRTKGMAGLNEATGSTGVTGPAEEEEEEHRDEQLGGYSPRLSVDFIVVILVVDAAAVETLVEDMLREKRLRTENRLFAANVWVEGVGDGERTLRRRFIDSISMSSSIPSGSGSSCE